MSVWLFKDGGDGMGIETNCETEDEFLDEYAAAIEELIDQKAFDDDWSFQLRWWNEYAVALCSFYRGRPDEKHTVVTIDASQPRDLFGVGETRGPRARCMVALHPSPH